MNGPPANPVLVNGPGSPSHPLLDAGVAWGTTLFLTTSTLSPGVSSYSTPYSARRYSPGSAWVRTIRAATKTFAKRGAPTLGNWLIPIPRPVPPLESHNRAPLRISAGLLTTMPPGVAVIASSGLVRSELPSHRQTRLVPRAAHTTRLLRCVRRLDRGDARTKDRTHTTLQHVHATRRANASGATFVHGTRRRRVRNFTFCSASVLAMGE